MTLIRVRVPDSAGEAAEAIPRHARPPAVVASPSTQRRPKRERQAPTQRDLTMSAAQSLSLEPPADPAIRLPPLSPCWLAHGKQPLRGSGDIPGAFLRASTNRLIV